MAVRFFQTYHQTCFVCCTVQASSRHLLTVIVPHRSEHNLSAQASPFLPGQLWPFLYRLTLPSLERSSLIKYGRKAIKIRKRKPLYIFAQNWSDRGTYDCSSKSICIQRCAVFSLPSNLGDKVIVDVFSLAKSEVLSIAEIPHWFSCIYPSSNLCTVSLTPRGKNSTAHIVLPPPLLSFYLSFLPSFFPFSLPPFLPSSFPPFLPSSLPSFHSSIWSA